VVVEGLGQASGGPVPKALSVGPQPLHLRTGSVVWHHWLAQGC
jgi:hypothetical protein